MHIKTKLEISEIMQKNEQLICHRAWLRRALRRFTLPCSTSRAVMLDLPDVMPHLLQCPALPCPELPHLVLL